MQVTKDVHALKIDFQIPISADKTVDRFVYVYLIYSERIWLIDTGVAAAGPYLIDYIRKSGRAPKDIGGIILTHSHPDHIGSARAIKEASGCTIAAHGNERHWIEDVDLQARERPVPGFRTLVGGPVRVERVLNEGDTIDLGKDLRLDVIHTPGHSKGSISLLLRDQGLLFCGDAVPISHEMPIYDDAAASVLSVKKLKAVGGIKHLLASWDPPRESGSAYESLDKGLRWLERIDDAVQRVDQPGPAGDPTAWCVRVLNELGLPPVMANPLVARSFQANVQARADWSTVSGPS